jgi:hypothetical protein
MKKFEVRMTMLVAVSVEVEADNEEQAEKQAMEKTAREEAYYLQHYDSIWEREVTEVNECEPEDDDDPLAKYSETYRDGIRYMLSQLDEDDKAIIRAECNKALSQHLIPDGNIVDDSKITDLLEEYGADEELPEGWYLEEYDASEILMMI